MNLEQWIIIYLAVREQLDYLVKSTWACNTIIQVEFI